MGTRNLVCVVKDGEFRVAQYGQWDGYPTGQGSDIADFLCRRYNKDKFAAQVDKIVHLSNDEVKEKWKSVGADDSGFVNMKTSEAFKKKYSQLSRDCGAKVLDHINNAEQPEVKMDLDFAADSLFCEFAYVLDLDKEMLEVYKGFNKKPLSQKERFFFLQDLAYIASDGSNYYPVKLFKKIPFSEITPVNTMKQLEKEMNGDEQ